jgi:hypothetical protein
MAQSGHWADRGRMAGSDPKRTFRDQPVQAGNRSALALITGLISGIVKLIEEWEADEPKVAVV